MHWHHAVSHHASEGRAYVLATVLATSGSAPRDSHTKMVITSGACDDSIGGGQLEHQVTERARAMISAGQTTAAIHHFPLAAATAQCCGGSVTVLLECFAHPAVRVAVFGAGHVGRRVVGLLTDLDAQISWYDARAEQASEANVRCELLDDAQAAVAGHDHVLILTHDHQLDFELVCAALDSNVEHIGLIGSATKAKRFSARLSQRGYSDEAIGRVRCPVGQRLKSKQPMAVAIGIVAELLDMSQTAPAAQSPLRWRQIKEALLQTGEPAQTNS